MTVSGAAASCKLAIQSGIAPENTQAPAACGANLLDAKWPKTSLRMTKKVSTRQKPRSGRQLTHSPGTWIASLTCDLLRTFAQSRHLLIQQVTAMAVVAYNVLLLPRASWSFLTTW